MTSDTVESGEESVRRRQLLGEVLLTAGVTLSIAEPDRWARFVRGDLDLKFGELELDSLSLNELSVSLELRAGLRLTPAELAAHSTLNELAGRFDAPRDAGGEHLGDAGSGPFPASRAATPISMTNRAVGVSSARISSLFQDIVGSATPRELIALAQSPLARVPHLSPARRFASMLPSADHDHRRWTRRFLAPDVLLYEGSRRTPTTTPVLVFGGNARRPMMPMALFLSALADATELVILVRSRKNDAFRSGIAGLGSGMDRSFRELAHMVQRRLDRSADGPMPVVIGTSGGGLPALIFSEYLPSCRVVMVGPNSTDDPRWAGSTSLARMLGPRAYGKERPHVIVCYGGDSRDVAKVAAWRRDLPDAQMLAIPGAPHNALYPLFQRDELTNLLREWI